MNLAKGKKLYVVNYWLPFPNSEYGGVEGYIASDTKELFDMIVESSTDDYYREQQPRYKEMIRKVVSNAKIYPLQDDNAVSGLAFEFTT